MTPERRGKGAGEKALARSNRLNMALNTNAHEYVIHLSSLVVGDVRNLETSSKQVVRILKTTDSRIKDGGFNKAVLEAIFMEALEDHYESEEKAIQMLARLKKKYGMAKAKAFFFKNCDMLRIWKYENAKFIPDAFLIDEDRRTIVCYEVEDTNPININSLGKYIAAWWLMDALTWDLHLIAYDIFGNPRVIDLLSYRNKFYSTRITSLPVV
jgi:hypothetical protein